MWDLDPTLMTSFNCTYFHRVLILYSYTTLTLSSSIQDLWAPYQRKLCVIWEKAVTEVRITLLCRHGGSAWCIKESYPILLWISWLFLTWEPSFCFPHD